MPIGRNGEPEPLRRELSLLGLWLLITNAMIGAGIFGVPAEAARLAGGFSPWIFLICGVLIFPIILCFAHLASYFRATGGPVAYIDAAFGRGAAFQAGWALYVGRTTAFAANANLLVNTLLHSGGATPQPALRLTLLFVICAFLTLLNVVSARGAIRWLGALTIMKLVPLIALILVGLRELHPALLFRTMPPIHDTGAAVLVVIYAFMGFESGPVAAGEAKDPQRDFPRALMLALGTCCIVYALVQWVAVAALPSLAVSPRPLIDTAYNSMGTVGGILLTAGVAASVAGNLTSNMFTIPRITYRLSLDGHLPRWLGAIHPTYRTPIGSIVFFGGVCFGLAAGGSFVWLVGLSVVTRVLLYLACVAAVPRVGRYMGPVAGVLRLPGKLFVPLLAAGVCVILLSQATSRTYAVVALFLLIGSVLFLASARSPGSADGRFIDRS